MSPRNPGAEFTRLTLLGLAVSLAGAAAVAQYPGQVSKDSKDTPELRAVGVLEWTGDPGKPKTSRLVPITVYNGEGLQDGSVYLARPQPMALDSDVEYVLQKDGKPFGLYDIQKAGEEQGSWVGFGSWKPMPVPKPKATRQIIDSGFDVNDDKPVLHRRHGGDSDSKTPPPPPDPDRPTLHKEPSDSSNSSSAPPPDPDRPTLHEPAPAKQPNSSSDPVLHKPANPETSDDDRRAAIDPNRPRLIPGKPTGNGPAVLPSLMGLPADMQQAVAVSDAKSRPEHVWSYKWANPADEGKMKEQMEDIARKALGLEKPPAPAPKHATAKSRAKAKKAPAPEPAPLLDEKFRVFELAYGSGATMVLSAHTDGPLADQKFVTLIAQPDLYGDVLVLLKNVTDGAHLDETPRMHLIDAVDAMADNRGELLFELRGATQRQFALYRVLRGSAEKIFVTGGGAYGVAPGE
jgi:hypothetical protein